MEKSEINKSSMEIPQNYEAPSMEIVEVKVEKGFALSGPPLNEDDGNGAW